MDLNSYRPLYPDELLYGWIMDLANYNFPNDSYGCQRIVNALFPFSKNPLHSKKLSREPIRKDFLQGLDSSIRMLKERGYTVPDTTTLLAYHTPLIITGLSRSARNQARYIHYTTADVTGSPLDSPTLPLIIKDIKCCPHCLKIGRYVRTWHNLPGVNFCAMHKTRLVHYDFKNFINFDLNMEYLIQQHIEIDYAIYVKTIYDNLSDISLDDIREIMHEYRSSSAKISIPFPSVVRTLIDFHVDYTKLALKSVSRVLPKIPAHIELLSNEYAIGTFRCLKCGTTWTDAIISVQIGFGCPKCTMQQDPDDFAATLLRNVGDGNYFLAEKLNGIGSLQYITHSTCGQTKLTSLTAKIWHGTTCACEKAHSITDVQNIIDNLKEGFFVEQYTPTKETMILYHKYCDNRFRVLLSAFRANPSCPYCYQKDKDEKKYVSLKTALGNDYKIISFQQNDFVTVLHKRCGQIQTRKYSSFINSRACPLCVPYRHEKRLTAHSTYEAALLIELRNWFQEHKIWISRHHLNGKQSKQYYNALSLLEKNGFIYRISFGIYSDQKDLSVYDVINEKYLLDDKSGKRIGSFTENTLKYLNGELQDEPEIITLETTALKRKSTSIVKICDRTVKIRGVKCK